MLNYPLPSKGFYGKMKQIIQMKLNIKELKLVQYKCG